MSCLAPRGGHRLPTLTGLFFAGANLSKLKLAQAELEDCTASDVDFIVFRAIDSDEDGD